MNLQDKKTVLQGLSKGSQKSITSFSNIVSVIGKVKDVLEAGTMPIDETESKNGIEEDENVMIDDVPQEDRVQTIAKGKKKKSLEDEDLGPVALAELGSRRGSRFSADGTPLFLRAFLESANPSLHFQFCFKGIAGKHGLAPLDEEFDRRIMGKKDRYEMFEGDFRQPEAFKQPTMAEGSRYRIADIYHLQVDPEVVLHVGIIPGWRVPVVTDSNPHLEGLLDQHRIIYMPYSEEKNVVMELPCSPGLFFSSQLISGGELVIAFDRSLHKYWALHINQVYTPPKYARNYDWNLLKSKGNPDEDFDEISWRRAIENQAYCDRVLQLLTEFGLNLEVIIRVAPTTNFFQLLSHEEDDKKNPSQARLDNYFREEIVTCKGQIRHYYYEKEAIIYGFYEESTWKFGMKDRGRNNGYAIKMTSLDSLFVNVDVAKFPI